MGDGKDLARILPIEVIRVGSVEESAQAGTVEATEIIHRTTAGALAYAATVNEALTASRAKLQEALA